MDELTPPASSTIKSDLTHARVGFTTNDRKPLRWCSACDLMWNFSVTPQWLTSMADVCRSPRSVPAVCSKTECFADCDQNAGWASAENALRATVLFYSLILYNVQVEEGEAVNAGKFSRAQFIEIIQTTFWISNWRGRVSSRHQLINWPHIVDCLPDCPTVTFLFYFCLIQYGVSDSTKLEHWFIRVTIAKNRKNRGFCTQAVLKESKD